MPHYRSALALLLAAGLCAGCSNPEKERQKLGISPTYDKATGKLTELTLDANKNGRIDTWTDMDGARPVQTRIDKNEDGRIDRWEYYDAKGQLQKVGFSRKDDGKADAWAFAAPDGRIEKIEISSVADDKKIDRWEHYDAAGLIAAEEDTTGDGVVDKWETYQRGALKSAAFDENGDGKPDRRLTYDGGTLLTIETEPDAAGHFTKRVDVK